MRKVVTRTSRNKKTGDLMYAIFSTASSGIHFIVFCLNANTTIYLVYVVRIVETYNEYNKLGIWYLQVVQT